MTAPRADQADLNIPIWGVEHPVQPHQEVWYLKLNGPDGRALWIRYTLLVNQAGTRRIAETWAVAFERRPDGTVAKTAAKNTYPIDSFHIHPDNPAHFAIGESSFSNDLVQGQVRSEDHSIQWGFNTAPATVLDFDFVPETLRRFGVVNNLAVTPREDLLFSGWAEVDGARWEWQDAPGMQGHLAGAKNGYAWAWAHCNLFTDEAGHAAPVIFDGLSARARIKGNLATPHLSTLFFRIGTEEYRLNTVWDTVRIRSKYTPAEWRFRARAAGAQFEGRVAATLTDFAGVTYEDTDGSHLYCHNSKVSDMTLDVRRDGGSVERYHAAGTVAYEFVTRAPHPEVPFLL